MRIIKKCYFDCCVYNHLLKLPKDVQLILSFIKKGYFNVLFSEFNLKEFANSIKDIPRTELANNLLILAKTLCNTSVIKSPETIIKEEILSKLSKKSSQNIFLQDILLKNMNFNNSFMLNNEGQNLIQKNKQDKKDFIKTMEISCKNTVDNFRKTQTKIPDNFEEYYKCLNSDTKYVLSYISLIPETLYLENLSEQELNTINSWDFNTIDSLRYNFRAFFFLGFRAEYNNLTENKKPKLKHGDDEDWRQTTYLKDMDIFVTDDEEYRDLLKNVNPNKEIFSLTEFLKKYKV